MDDDSPPNNGVRPLKQGLVGDSENTDGDDGDDGDGDGDGDDGHDVDDGHGHLSIVDSDLGVAKPICVNVA